MNLLEKLKQKQNPGQKPKKSGAKEKAEPASTPGVPKAASKPEHSHKGLKPGEKCPDCGVVHHCRTGPKQDTRMHKVACLACGWIVRMSSKAINIGLPNCPQCGVRAEVISKKKDEIPF